MTKQNKRSSSHHFGLLFLLLVLLIIAGLGGAGFWWQKQQQANYLQSVNQLEHGLQQSSAQLTQLQQQQQKLAQQLLSTQTSLQGLAKNFNNNDAQWLMADVAYLTRLAYYTLQISHNVPTALALLTTADQQLSRLYEPRLLTVRKALANSITQLNAVPKLDINGIISKLAALSEQLAKLLFLLPTHKVETHKTNITQVQGWRGYLQQAWDTMRGMISIQRLQDNAMTVLSPVQQNNIRHQITALLIQAQWAVLHRESQVYQASLIQAENLVAQYFDQNSLATQAWLQSLNALRQMTVDSELPNLQALLKVVQKFTAQALDGKEK